MKKYLLNLLITTSLCAEHVVRIVTEGDLIDRKKESALKKEIAQIVQKYTPDSSPVHIEISPSFKDSNTLLEEVYRGINGFNVDATDTQKVTAAGGNPTYGEATNRAVDILQQELKLGQKDAVIDLGCGIGRLCTKMHLDTPICLSIGVELSEGRFKNAKGAKKRLDHICRTKAHTLHPELRQNLAKSDRKLEFQHQDMLKFNWSDPVDIVLNGGRVMVWICSTCFSPELMEKLAAMFGSVGSAIKEKAGRQISGNIIILTLKDFPHSDIFEKYFKQDKTHSLDMTWSSGVTVHQYSLRK